MATVILNDKEIPLYESVDVEFINFYNLDQIRKEYENNFKNYNIKFFSWSDSLYYFDNFETMCNHLKTYNLPVRSVLNLEQIDTIERVISVKAYPLIESA